MPNTKTQLLLRRLLRRQRRKRQSRRPTIRFSPYAWAKLLYLRDLGPTEVGGFGIAQSDDLLSVHDFALLKQQCTETFVAFDDVAVADFFEDQVVLGRRPEQVGRIWIHTHPGDSPQPSHVDVETFQRVFGGCDWAVMFIIARSGHTYAELHWRHGGPASIRLDVEVDFSRPFSGSAELDWKKEYQAAVHAQSWRTQPVVMRSQDAFLGEHCWDGAFEDLMGLPLDGFPDIPPILSHTEESQ